MIAGLRTTLIAGLALLLSAGARAASYKVIYTFQNDADGAAPSGQLTVHDGAFYGVTTLGGSDCDCGTLYRLSFSGAHSVLHRFHGQPDDGANPAGGVGFIGPVLYGTTTTGGANECPSPPGGNCGTIFSLDAAGKYKIVHNFTRSEGAQPTADLATFADALWGLVVWDGTVFKIKGGGDVSVWPMTFGGTVPSGGVTWLGGRLYGTTSKGGPDCTFLKICGTVWSMTPAGDFATVYNFPGKTIGDNPSGTLLDHAGLLYGTTRQTIFAVSPAGAATLVYTFKGSDDAASGGPGLTYDNGTFYGVSYYGGGTGCESKLGCGVIYAVTPSGTESVVYRFDLASGGQHPNGRLLLWNNALYGVTASGGATGKCGGGGCGTVYQFTP